MTTIVVGTAGHIDHGKSALVKALTGTDPDRLKEEQVRGITIDLGFAHASIGDVEAAFVDVPGHERFVRHMLAGVGGIDAVLLVIAADESIKPQTREHFDICRLLGIERGAIVLSKSDLVDRDTIEIAAIEARELVAGSSLDDAPIVPVSAKTGAGLDDLRAVIEQLARTIKPRGRSGVARLPVDRVFSVKGFGAVVTGTLGSGEVRDSSELVALPEGRVVRVRGLQVHGRAAAVVAAPSRVAVNLGSVDAADLTRGTTLASPGTLSVTRRIDVRIALVPDAGPLLHGARVRLHHGTAEILGRVAIAGWRGRDIESWTAALPGERGVAVPRGGEGYARIRLERPVVLTRGDRAVIRAYSPPRTMAGAVVLDPEPPAAGIRRATALGRFQALDDERNVAEAWMNDAALKGIDAAELVRRGGLGAPDAARVVDNLVARGLAARFGARIIAATRAADIERGISEEVRRFHETDPLEVGIPREALRGRVASGAPADVFDAIVEALVARGVLTGTERLALHARSPQLDPKSSRTRTAIENALRAGGLAPPDPAALQTAASVTPALLDQMLRLLIRDQRAAKIGGIVFHADTLDSLRADMRALKSAAGADATVDIGTFKMRYGISRKFAIPLLEWLDKERVTRRVGERRVLL